MPTLEPNATYTVRPEYSGLEMYVYTVGSHGGFTIQTKATPCWMFWLPAVELVEVDAFVEIEKLQARVDQFCSNGI